MSCRWRARVIHPVIPHRGKLQTAAQRIRSAETQILAVLKDQRAVPPWAVAGPKRVQRNEISALVGARPIPELFCTVSA